MTPTTGTPSSATQPPAPTSSSSQSSASALSSMASESTFLQLLVAQLQNQDPTQPQDGTQFVSELATFSSVQQQLQMTEDLNSIKAILTADASQSTANQGSGASSTSGAPAQS